MRANRENRTGMPPEGVRETHRRGSFKCVFGSHAHDRASKKHALAAIQPTHLDCDGGNVEPGIRDDGANV
jgi:hypothetical protein